MKQQNLTQRISTNITSERVSHWLKAGIVTAIVGLLSIAGSEAQPIYFQTGFESSEGYTLGNLAGQEGWSGGSIYNTVQDDIVTLDNYAVQLTRPNGLGSSNPSANTFLSTGNGITDGFVFSFQLAANQVGAGTTGSAYVSLNQSTSSGSGIFLGIRALTVGGTKNLYLAYQDFNLSWIQIGTDPIDANAFYTFSGSADISTHTYNLQVSSVDDGVIATINGISFRAGKDKDAPAAFINEIRIVQDEQSAASPTPETKFYIDNIYIIPEPHTIALVCLFGALLFLLKRKKVKTV